MYHSILAALCVFILGVTETRAAEEPNIVLILADDRAHAAASAEEAGYGMLMVGKWHLGHASKQFWPQNLGFDYFYGNGMEEVDYFRMTGEGSLPGNVMQHS